MENITYILIGFFSGMAGYAFVRLLELIFKKKG